EERQWIEPRLAHLLGLEDDRQPREKEDLFGAWRLFFERLSERAPVVLVFEDVQWADAALLEFVEYLLEWSRNHRIYVVALARPDVADRHPDWPSSRNTTTLALDPLLEFVEYLLEWSRNHRIYVVALARPDVADRHPDWPSSRNTTTLALDPLS